MCHQEYGPIELYGRTKLAMILYTKSLFTKVIQKNGDDIYVLAVHPGAVSTHPASSLNPRSRAATAPQPSPRTAR